MTAEEKMCWCWTWCMQHIVESQEENAAATRSIIISQGKEHLRGEVGVTMALG